MRVGTKLHALHADNILFIENPVLSVPVLLQSLNDMVIDMVIPPELREGMIPSGLDSAC